MARIKSTAQQTNVTTLNQSWKIELPTSSYIQIYPRVSTPEQKKNVSAEMQVDKQFALSCGWLEDLIILDDRDLGVSGQVRMEDRLAFNGMNQNIANRIVKTVLVGQVDRLFRDRWGAEYAKFMEICYNYGVKVITLNPTRTAIDFIYDFSISWHVDQFRRKLEAADPRYTIYPRVMPISKKKEKEENPEGEDTRKYYGFYDCGDPERRLSYMIPVSEIDECFFTRLVQRLQHANEFENFLEYEQQELEQRERELAQIDRDILATQAAMKRIEEQTKNGEFTNPRLAKAANEQYGALEIELPRLEARKQALLARTSTRQRRIGFRRECSAFLHRSETRAVRTVTLAFSLLVSWFSGILLCLAEFDKCFLVHEMLGDA